LEDDGEFARAPHVCPELTRPALDGFARFRTDTRVAAAKHSEGNRRVGGVKSQTSTIKIWNVSLASLLSGSRSAYSFNLA
jgi:hypothetical protein